MIPVAYAVSVVLVAIAGSLRSAGASLVRTPRADALHDAADGDRRAERVARLLEDRVRVQPSISVVHASMLVAATLPAAWALTAQLSGVGLAASLVALGAAMVFLGELLPRAFGRDHPRTLAYRLSRLVEVAVHTGARAADLISDDETEDENGDESQALDPDDRSEIELISSVLEFSDTLVREVMVPRTDMVTIERDRSSDDALDVVVDHGFSRIPVVGSGPDDVVGVIYAKDLLKLWDEQAGTTSVTALMRPPYFVPETKLVPDLLRDMQLYKTHLAVVVDEFGGTAGLVTIEDILEELVGEIVDEYDVEESLVVAVEDGWVVDGRLNVDDLNDLLDTEFPDSEWDTIAGLILELAGRVPLEGEEFAHGDLILSAERIQGRRVGRVRIRRARLGTPKLEQA